MQHFDEVYTFIEDARISGGKCLIHCMRGVNRSGALTIGYVMVHNGVGPVPATQMVLAARGNVLSNHEFINQLVKFAAGKDLLTLDADDIEDQS